MNEQSINQQYQQICNLIEQRRLKEALTQLESYLWQCSDWTLRSQLEQLQTSYDYMLQYMRQKVQDPERGKLYNRLLSDIWEIADKARIHMLDIASPHYYHEVRRTPVPEDLKTYNLTMLLHILESYQDDLAVSGLLDNSHIERVLTKHEDTLKFMFLHTWTNSNWSPEDEEGAKAILKSELLPINDLCLFISAVTLSLMECFDLSKLLWLMEAYQHPSVQASQRALVGILLIFHIHPTRIKLYPQVKQRIEYLAEAPSLTTHVGHIYHQLLLCQETEKISRKMQEEIIPEVMKNMTYIRRMGFDPEDTDEEKDDKNPDWADAMEKAGVDDKLREINDLQVAGADVYMSTFAHLKNYPFFREIGNWFYPFDKSHSSIYKATATEDQEKKSILSFILESGLFCNSDKYSLFFTMYQLPQIAREMMVSQLAESKGVVEEMDEETRYILKKQADRPQTVSNQYLHDLYRFFKLNTRKKEFRDIFQEKIELYRLPFLDTSLDWNSILFPLADFLLTNEHWTEAAHLFKEIEKWYSIKGYESEFYQKLGYALQKEKKYEEAIEAYIKADTVKPDHLWTLSHLATCYRQTRNFTEALHCYQRVEAITPDNTKIIFYIGSCLAELQQYNEALRYFFKLDFLEENCVKAWRGIGWCSFLTNKMEQAAKYYDKVIATKATSIDYLNAGHIAWVMGDIEKAISLYQKSAGTNKEEFIELFYKDEIYLLERGIQKDDIPLMLDFL